MNQEASTTKMIIVSMIILFFTIILMSALWRISAHKINRDKLYQTEHLLFELNDTAVSYQIETRKGTPIYNCYDQQGTLIARFFLIDPIEPIQPFKIAVSVSPDWQRILGFQLINTSNKIEKDSISSDSQSNLSKELVDIIQTYIDVIKK